MFFNCKDHWILTGFSKKQQLWILEIRGNEEKVKGRSVFRYRGAEYVDKFFETCELKLSTCFGNRALEDVFCFGYGWHCCMSLDY